MQYLKATKPYATTNELSFKIYKQKYCRDIFLGPFQSL